jgi:spermidine synthase
MSTTPKKIRYDEVNISEFNGVRYLHLGYTPWIQGAMRIARPWKLEIEYTRNMMLWHTQAVERDLAIQHIVQLGLGAGSLTKHCYRTYPNARITVVELNPKVIAACHQFFKLMPSDSRLSIVQADAGEWVNHSRNHGTVDVLQIDLYDAKAQGPVLDTLEFYQACRACLSPHGMMTVNLFGHLGTTGTPKKGGFKDSYAAINTAFEGLCTASSQTDEGNIVVMAWK